MGRYMRNGMGACLVAGARQENAEISRAFAEAERGYAVAFCLGKAGGPRLGPDHDDELAPNVVRYAPSGCGDECEFVQ